MNAIDFENNSKNMLKRCWSLMFSKSKEYASDEDRLKNFKQPTTMMNTNQAKVCLWYDMKHIASIAKMAEDVDKGIIPTKELLEEKVGDYINYGLLFYSNMLEVIEVQKQQKIKKD